MSAKAAPAARVAEALAARLGHDFADPALLAEALTHASLSAERRGERLTNERLEFLGDRVLGLIVAELLFRRFPDAPEGDLAPRFNALVRKETCARIARAFGVDAALRLAPGEAATGGRAKTAVLGDACEAVIAALYLDGGLDSARRFVESAWADIIDTIEDAPPQEPKSALQEWAQARGGAAPTYAEIARAGPDHAPSFVVEVRAGDLSARGEGGSKRLAERAAAAALLRRLAAAEDGEDG